MVTTISAENNATLTEIEKTINSCAEYDTVTFEGVFRFKYNDKRLFMLGRESVQSGIMITKPNLFLDFSRAKIFLEVKNINFKFAFLNFYVTARNIKLSKPLKRLKHLMNKKNISTTENIQTDL